MGTVTMTPGWLQVSDFLSQYVREYDVRGMAEVIPDDDDVVLRIVIRRRRGPING